VRLEKVTVSPEVAVAVAVYVAPPTTAVVGAVEVNEIVWACFTTTAALASFELLLQEPSPLRVKLPVAADLNEIALEP
jgi:predicted transcriptional regulator